MFGEAKGETQREITSLVSSPGGMKAKEPVFGQRTIIIKEVFLFRRLKGIFRGFAPQSRGMKARLM